MNDGDGAREEEEERLLLRFGIDIGTPKDRGYGIKGRLKAD